MYTENSGEDTLSLIFESLHKRDTGEYICKAKFPDSIQDQRFTVNVISKLTMATMNQPIRNQSMPTMAADGRHFSSDLHFRFEEARGGPWRPEEARGGPWRPVEARGGPWRPVEARGGPRRIARFNPFGCFNGKRRLIRAASAAF